MVTTKAVPTIDKKTKNSEVPTQGKRNDNPSFAKAINNEEMLPLRYIRGPSQSALNNTLRLSDLKSMRKTTLVTNVLNRPANFVRTNDKNKTIQRNKQRNSKQVPQSASGSFRSSYVHHENPVVQSYLRGEYPHDALESGVGNLIVNAWYYTKFGGSETKYGDAIINSDLKLYIETISGHSTPHRVVDNFFNLPGLLVRYRDALCNLYRRNPAMTFKIHMAFTTMLEVAAADQDDFLGEELDIGVLIANAEVTFVDCIDALYAICAQHTTTLPGASPHVFVLRDHQDYLDSFYKDSISFESDDDEPTVPQSSSKPFRSLRKESYPLMEPQSARNAFSFGNLFPITEEERPPPKEDGPSMLEMMHSVYSDYKTGRMKETMSKSTELIKMLEASVEKIPADDIKELVSEIKKFVNSTNEASGDVVQNQFYAGAVVFIACSFIAIKYKKPIYIVLSILSGTFMMSQIDWQKILKKYKFMSICLDGISKMFAFMVGEKGQKPQASDEDIKDASETLALMYSFVVLGTSQASDVSENVYRKISMFDKISNNLGRAIKLVMSMGEKIYNLALEHLGGKDKNLNYVRWLRTNEVEIEHFMDDAQLIIDKYHAHRLVVSRINFLVVEKLMMKGRELCKNHGKSGKKPLPPLMLPIMKQLEIVYNKFSQHNYNSTGLRPEPAVLNLIGSAGIGKSIVSRQMLHYLLARILNTEELDDTYLKDPTQYIYNRLSNQPYWEGHYHTTLITTRDDMGQKPDSDLDTATSEWLEFIHAINMEPFPLNMAFELKGQMYYTSLLEVISMNKPSPELKSVTCKPAVYRRLNKGSFICYPKSEFCTDETRENTAIELKKLQPKYLVFDESDRINILPDTHWYQRIHYDDQGQISHIGNPMTWYQVVDHVIQSINLNKEQYEQQRTILEKVRVLAKQDVESNLMAITHQGENLFQRREGPENQPPPPDDTHTTVTQSSKADFDMEPLDRVSVSDDSSMEEYVNTFGLEDYDKEEHLRMLREGIEQMDTGKKVHLHEFVKRCSTKVLWHPRTKSFCNFYTELKEIYTHFNIVAASSFPAATPEEIWMAFFQVYGETWINVIDANDHDVYTQFITDVKHDIYAEDLQFDRVFHNVVIPSLAEKPMEYIVRKFKEWTEFLYNVTLKDSWLLASWNKFKEHVMENKMLYLLIAGGGMIGLAMDLLSRYYDNYNNPPIPKTVRRYNYIVDKEELLDLATELLNPDFSIEENMEYVKTHLSSINLVEARRDNRETDPESVTTKGRYHKPKHTVPRFKATTKPQGARGLDPCGNDILTKIMSKNTYSLHEPLDDVGTVHKISSILFIKDRFFIVHKHVVAIIQRKILDYGEDYENSKFIIRQTGGNGKLVEHKIRAGDFLKILLQGKMCRDMQDLHLVYMDYKDFDIPIPCRYNILKFIGTHDDHSRVGRYCKGVLYLPTPTGVDALIFTQVQRCTNHSPTYVDDMGAEYAPRNSYKYPASTQAGDCGSILALEKPSLGSVRIFGMHVSGDKDGNAVAYSEAIYRDSLEEAMETFHLPVIVDMPFDEERPDNQNNIGDGQFTAVETIPQAVPMNMSTTFKKSAFHSVFFLAKEAPAPLKPQLFNGKVTDPWNHNIRKFCKARVDVKQEYIEDICSQILIDLEKESFYDVDRRTLTREEAVLGSEEYNLPAIPRNTSPGYPHVLKPIPGLPKSTRWFGKEQKYNLNNKYWKEMEIRLDKMIENYKKGIRDMDIMAIDNLKDETIDIEKIREKLKARIFNSFPKEKQILDRMFFGAFNAWITKNRISNMNAVGVNVYSAEWDKIAKSLLRFGPATLRNVGAGDYSCFDGSQNSRIHLAIFFYIILPWYGYDIFSEEAIIMYMLYLDVHNSIHIRADVIYEWLGGMTSGGFLTLLLNFLYNRVNFYYAWYKLHGFELVALSRFRDYVYCVFMGDDNTFSVHPIYIGTFHCKWIQESSLDLGLVFTSETKGEVQDLRALTDVSFLKRKFRMCEETGRYVAPMELIPTIETLYWTRKGDNSDQIVRDNVDFVLKELALHGRQVYGAWSGKICAIARSQYGHTSDFQTYRLALHSVLDTPAFL